MKRTRISAGMICGVVCAAVASALAWPMLAPAHPMPALASESRPWKQPPPFQQPRSIRARAAAQPSTVRHFPLRRLPLGPNAGMFAGLVTTLSGPFNVAAAVTYDSQHKVFYFAGLGQIDQVTLSGTTTKIANFNPQVGGLAYDATTQLIYATDFFGSAVYSISLSGVTTLVAGGTRGTNDGQGANAQFQGPTGIALDPVRQILYIADADRIRVMTTSFNVTTLTLPGSIGQFGFSGFQAPTFGLAFDGVAKLLYVADSSQDTIDVVTPAGNVSILSGRCISVIGGSCDPLQIDGQRLVARYAEPMGVVISPIDRGIYVADFGNNAIRHISPTGQVTTLAGSGIAGNTDALGILASFAGPAAITIDPPTGKLMVADLGNRELRTVTTVGSIPSPPPHGTLLFDPPTQDSGPSSIVVASDSTVWFTEQNAGKIGRRTPSGVITEFRLPSGRANPNNIVIGPDGAAWFTDTPATVPGGNAAVGRISGTGAIVEYLVPSHGPFGQPVLAGLTVGSDKNLWFADPQNSGLGVITPLGRMKEFTAINLGPIVTGFDGNLWGTGGNTSTASVWRYGTNGRLLNAYSPSEPAFNIGSGPDSAMWFAASGIPLEEIGRLTVTGQTTYFALPPTFGCFKFVSNFKTGPNSNVWFLESTSGCGAFVGETTTIGGITLFPIYAARSAPSSLAFAPDGSAWFADLGANKIGKLY